MNFNQKFVERMGSERRIPGSQVAQFYMDVAASAQQQLEKAVLHLIAFHTVQSGIKNVCLSGGVALNCLMNQKIMNADFVDALFVQPASTDAGISMGAAWLASLESNIDPIVPDNTYLGNEYTNGEIERTLQLCHVPYTRLDDVIQSAAKDLADGKVIGWYQAKMEFGPRALGNRSILANPCMPDMQALVNQKIKFRESFRPFGASVLEEDVPVFFRGKPVKAPYMTLVYEVREEAKKLIPSVVHADGTCRIQTVSKADNLLYYNLLAAFKRQSGHGVLLNTSFNLSHEPIVNTPREAIASFYASGLDALYLGHCRISK
jgi:carbamoyltransferase